MALSRTACRFYKHFFFKYTAVTPAFSFCDSANKIFPLHGKLKENPSKYGPLTNLPDFSFVDGRPIPLSYRTMKKLELQERLCKRIVELSNELDVGLANYYKNQEKIQENRKTILSRKLKPKGAALLKNSKNINIK